MLIIICRCWPLIHPFIYLFWKHVCARLDGLWNLKQRGKIPPFWGMLNSAWDHSHSMDICTIFRWYVLANKHTRAHKEKAVARTRRGMHGEGNTYTPISFLSSLSFTSLALPFSPGRFRVPQMCHQTLVSIWTWRKKEILNRKVYKKRTLWIFDILCTAASKWVGWRGKEKQLQDMFLFICCLFSLSSFREMEASTRPQLTHPCIDGLSAGPWKKNRHG